MDNYITRLMSDSLDSATPVKAQGRIIKATSTLIKASAPEARIGELCRLESPGGPPLIAEVIGFDGPTALLTPLGQVDGLGPETRVIPLHHALDVKVGYGLLGRVLDGFGQPIDGKGAFSPPCQVTYPIIADPPNALNRNIIDEQFFTGVRAIDGFMTAGLGQRLGIFAAAGAGKTTLLSMLVKRSSVDIVVVALIGERGREVREFIDDTLGDEGMGKTIIVAATSDRPAMERVKAAFVATAIAEYFRDQGLRVLLLMDSVTRFARAQREVGLASGEVPTRRGFPPSVFAQLPRLMERAGQSTSGSITAFYTVLVEGEDMNEPVADETRSILDGHIVLSRELVAKNHFPAIDVQASLSRLMQKIASQEHNHAAGKIRDLLAAYAEVELLLRVGEYQRGADPRADEAITKIQDILAFLRQRNDEATDPESTRNWLLSMANS